MSLKTILFLKRLVNITNWSEICVFIRMICFFISLILWMVPFVDQENSSRITPIISAIQGGSSSELARHLNESIALNISGKQGDYSKTQAEIVLKDFFKKYPPLEFSLVFKNENHNNISSYIGKYSSGKDNFQIFIKISHSNSSFLIYSLDFIKS